MVKQPFIAFPSPQIPLLPSKPYTKFNDFLEFSQHFFFNRKRNIIKESREEKRARERERG